MPARVMSLVADHFGIGRSFFEGGDKKLGGFHGDWQFSAE